MRKTVSEAIFLIRILLLPGGPIRPKTGGALRQTAPGGWEGLCGQALTIVVNPRHSSGRISIHISGSWICAGSRRIFTITTSHGGPIKTYCIFHHTGTGKEKKGSPLMFG